MTWLQKETNTKNYSSFPPVKKVKELAFLPPHSWYSRKKIVGRLLWWLVMVIPLSFKTDLCSTSIEVAVFCFPEEKDEQKSVLLFLSLHHLIDSEAAPWHFYYTFFFPGTTHYSSLALPIIITRGQSLVQQSLRKKLESYQRKECRTKSCYLSHCAFYQQWITTKEGKYIHIIFFSHANVKGDSSNAKSPLNKTVHLHLSQTRKKKAVKLTTFKN